MTRYTTTDVLICGAGVTGLTLAIELARHGVSFRLIEKRTTPFIGSRGKGIQPRTQEIFEDLGILNKVVAAGGLYPRLRTYRHDGSYILFILLARTLFGISAGNLSAAAAYIADCTHVRNRRQAIGILTGCIGLGGIVGAGVSGWLSRISLGAPIYAAFILVLGAALVAIWGLKDPSTTSCTTDKIASFSARAILKMPVLRVLIIVMLCHFFAYGMYSSQLPVFLSDTFIWNGLPFGPKALSYLLMADGVINIFVQLFLLGWVSQYFSERKLIILIFALLCTGFLTAGIATTIPVLIFAIVCISIADALAKPTYLAALSVHVSPARQGIVIGTAQALIAIADFISPVLGGLVLGYALYGVWIGIAISVAIIGLVTAMIYLSKSSVLIVKPETE